MHVGLKEATFSFFFAEGHEVSDLQVQVPAAGLVVSGSHLDAFLKAIFKEE